MLPKEDIRNIRNAPYEPRQVVVVSSVKISSGGWDMAEFSAGPTRKRTVFKAKAEPNHSWKWRQIRG